MWPLSSSLAPFINETSSKVSGPRSGSALKWPCSPRGIYVLKQICLHKEIINDQTYQGNRQTYHEDIAVTGHYLCSRVYLSRRQLLPWRYTRHLAARGVIWHAETDYDIVYWYYFWIWLPPSAILHRGGGFPAPGIDQPRVPRYIRYVDVRRRVSYSGELSGWWDGLGWWDQTADLWEPVRINECKSGVHRGVSSTDDQIQIGQWTHRLPMNFWRFLDNPLRFGTSESRILHREIIHRIYAFCVTLATTDGLVWRELIYCDEGYLKGNRNFGSNTNSSGNIVYNYMLVYMIYDSLYPDKIIYKLVTLYVISLIPR